MDNFRQFISKIAQNVWASLQLSCRKRTFHLRRSVCTAHKTANFQCFQTDSTIYGGDASACMRWGDRQGHEDQSEIFRLPIDAICEDFALQENFVCCRCRLWCVCREPAWMMQRPWSRRPAFVYWLVTIWTKRRKWPSGWRRLSHWRRKLPSTWNLSCQFRTWAKTLF